MSDIAGKKQEIFAWIDEKHDFFSKFHMQIWNYAETAWREYKSAKAFCDLLRAEGFDVEEGSGGMPTAFAATWKNGEGGHVVGALAEYDAVPGNSQQPVPYRAPREGLHPWAPGHTDPHSSLGTTALASILATKAIMERHNISGTLKLFGEPAEKMCGSKAVHATKGYFDGVDAFVLYHPKWTNTVLFDMQYGSYWSVVFTFETPNPEKWGRKEIVPNSTGAHNITSNSHAMARCPGAIDALCLMYTSTKYTKEAMFPHTGTWTLNEFVLAAGDATSDNLAPRFSQIQYSWRSPTLEIQQQIYDVLENNAKHAAGIAGCQVSVRWIAKTRTGLVNHTMANAAYENMKVVGPTQFSEEAKDFARAIQTNLGVEPLEDPFIEASTVITDPRDYDAMIKKTMPEWQKNFMADDYVEYTWHAPACRIFTTSPLLRSPLGAAFEYPAWTNNAMTGVPAIIDPGILVGAKTASATMLDMLLNPELLAKAKAEFNERTGGGIGGEKWVAPLLPKDFVPPVDLRWPEYVETVRGREWTLPTPFEGSGAGTLLQK